MFLCHPGGDCYWFGVYIDPMYAVEIGSFPMFKKVKNIQRLGTKVTLYIETSTLGCSLNNSHKDFVHEPTISSCSKFCQQKTSSWQKQLHLGPYFAHVQGSCFAIGVRPQFKKMPRGHGPSKSLSAEISPFPWPFCKLKKKTPGSHHRS